MSELQGPVLGVALGLGASVAWAVANIAIARASRLAGNYVPLLWGQLFGSLVLLPALWWWPPPGGFDAWGWLLLAGMASAFAYSGLFRAFGSGPVSVLSPIIASWAVVSAGMGVLLFGEELPPLRALGALLVVGGVMAIASRRTAGEEDEGWLGPRWRGLAAAATSALGFGFMVGALGPVAHELGPVAGILAVWAVQWLVLLTVALRRTRGRLLPPRAALPAIALLGISEAAGFLLVEVGVLSAPLTVVAPTSSTAALFTVLLGRLWLSERVGWDRLLLAAVVVAGVGLLAVG